VISSRLPRRLLVVAVALLLLAAAAFGLSRLTGGGRPASSNGEDRVVIAVAGDVTTLDPHMTAAVGGNLSILSHIYPALILRGPDLALTPSIARSWRTLSPNRWRLDLVRGARFANGEPIDAATVKWNLDRVRDPAAKARIRLWFEPITAVEVVDDHTVDIVTAAPFPALPAQLSMLFLLPPHWAQTHDPATETMAGGPYALAENVPGERLTLVRNPSYWGPKPAFGHVEFRIIPSPTARVAALLAGEVDLVINIPLAEVARIRADGRADAGSVPSIRSVFIKFNTLTAPLNDVRVRRALNLAIDKQGISNALFDGQARVSPCQLLTPDYLGFNPDLAPIPYDPQAARALLREAGIRPGTPIRFEVPVAYTLQGEEVAQVVAAQLKAVGLAPQIVQLESSQYMDRYIKGRQLAPLSVLTHAWPTIDADGLLSLLQSDSPYAYYRDPVFDRLLAEGRATLSPQAREQTYRKATARMCETAPVLFLYAQPYTFATSRRLTWRPRGDDWIRAFDMTPARPSAVP
jgi:peptide/nickel transport system substrate-binding protein